MLLPFDSVESSWESLTLLSHPKSAANRICKKCSQINASLKVSEAQLARQRGSKRLNGNLIEEQDTYEVIFF
jgi:hypothetical protein